MWLLFLDEFGNAGLKETPTSHPAFGYAGILVNSVSFDRLSRIFLTIKAMAFIQGENSHPLPRRQDGLFNLKKLGNKRFNKILSEVKSRTVLHNRRLENDDQKFKETQAHRNTVRLLNEIERSGARIFLYGFEKIFFTQNKIYPQLNVDLIEDIVDKVAEEGRIRSDEILVFFDKHPSDSQRERIFNDRVIEMKLFRYIRKTPSFCNSQWSQGVQIADWICFLAGRIMGQYCANPFPAYRNYRREYGRQFRHLFSHTSLFQCRGTQQIRAATQLSLDEGAQRGVGGDSP